MSENRVSFLERWRRFRRLAPEDRGLVLRGMAFLSLTMLGLRTMSFQRCKKLIWKFSLSDATPGRIDASRQMERREKIMSAMNALIRNIPLRPNCLERSLALWWLFQRNGIDCDLQIGGRKNEGKFEAHAWVESDGKVVNDSSDVHKHYARFDAPIAAGKGDTH